MNKKVFDKIDPRALDLIVENLGRQLLEAIVMGRAEFADEVAAFIANPDWRDDVSGKVMGYAWPSKYKRTKRTGGKA